MKNKDISTVFISIGHGLQRYSVTILIVVLAGGLGTAVILLNNIIQQSSDTNGYISPTTSTTFDQSTITRIEQLHTSSSFTGQVTLPAGRIDPFSE